MKHLSDDHIERLRRALDAPDLSGTRYDLGERIGSGGMATVYLARDRELDRRVAIKVVSLLDESGEMSRRMLHEARIVALLEHPGIVPIHDVGTLPDGRVFYAMKYVEGQTLDHFRQHGQNRSELLRIYQKLCDAIAFAHSRGVIHRDLKPANVMVGAFGEVLVMDWGIAMSLTQPAGEFSLAAERSFKEAPPSTTSPGAVIGTPEFMSPEQARGDREQIDQRSDIYSLGAVLYFLLVGRSPFLDADAATIREKVISGQYPALRSIDRKLPRALEAICSRAMARNRELRYSSVTELSDDISRFLDDQPVNAYRENLLEQTWRWVNRNKVIVLIVIAYMLVRFLIFQFIGQ